ncbi:MAG: peptidoglycan binding domain-containing protein, partial [Lachnospiraceae bacterium]|nr:peptidoglycan binding domain-containing protein [Lachnospiraceae bacterium]
MKLQFRHREKTEQRTENTGKDRKLLIVSALIIMVPLLCLLVVYIAGLGRYQSCFLNGTVIDMVDVSDMSITELEGRIGQYSLRVIERQADGTTLEEEIPGSEIGLSYISTEPLQTILQEQNSFLWFVKQDAVYEMEDMLHYEEAVLVEKIGGLSGFQKEFIQEPTDAYIADYVPGSGFELVAETPGNRLNRDKTIEVIKAAVEGLEERVDLE